MQKQDNTERNYNWLYTLLSIAVMCVLALVYIFWHPENDNYFGKLVINSIPSAIVVLIAIPIIYILFELMDLRFFRKTIQLDSTEVSNLIIKSMKEQRFPQLFSFEETFRNVDWKQLLQDCGNNSHIDIVVYYFDSWVNSNYDSLVTFFKKKDTSIRIFVSNPSDLFILENVKRLFPEYSVEVIKDKIIKTYERFKNALNEARGDMKRIEFYYVPHFLNYSAQCIYGKYLILSFYEMFRNESRIDSPAIIIDLEKSDHLFKYWHKELDGLLKISSKIE